MAKHNNKEFKEDAIQWIGDNGSSALKSILVIVVCSKISRISLTVSQQPSKYGINSYGEIL